MIYVGSKLPSPSAAFETPRRSSTQEFTVIIEPALGAGGRRRVIKAETRAEAELKAKQMAKEIFEAEMLIQFVE
jgi:hypothetical protein